MPYNMPGGTYNGNGKPGGKPSKGNQTGKGNAPAGTAAHYGYSGPGVGGGNTQVRPSGPQGSAASMSTGGGSFHSPQQPKPRPRGVTTARPGLNLSAADYLASGYGTYQQARPSLPATPPRNMTVVRPGVTLSAGDLTAAGYGQYQQPPSVSPKRSLPVGTANAFGYSGPGFGGGNTQVQPNGPQGSTAFMSTGGASFGPPRTAGVPRPPVLGGGLAEYGNLRDAVKPYHPTARGYVAANNNLFNYAGTKPWTFDTIGTQAALSMPDLTLGGLQAGVRPPKDVARLPVGTPPLRTAQARPNPLVSRPGLPLTARDYIGAGYGQYQSPPGEISETIVSTDPYSPNITPSSYTPRTAAAAAPADDGGLYGGEASPAPGTGSGIIGTMADAVSRVGRKINSPFAKADFYAGQLGLSGYDPTGEARRLDEKNSAAPTLGGNGASTPSLGSTPLPGSSSGSSSLPAASLVASAQQPRPRWVYPGYYSTWAGLPTGYYGG